MKASGAERKDEQEGAQHQQELVYTSEMLQLPQKTSSALVLLTFIAFSQKCKDTVFQLLWARKRLLKFNSPQIFSEPNSL
ncbi:hypothetical protein TNCV_2864261 [Trichonephila clavipes]|nr:hypothetical protein TNCV_2864261 [Trichonephila clavipes]